MKNSAGNSSEGDSKKIFRENAANKRVWSRQVVLNAVIKNKTF
jgi:hypothetical protein